MIKPLNPKWMTSKTRNSMKVKTEKCLRPIRHQISKITTIHMVGVFGRGSKNRFVWGPRTAVVFFRGLTRVYSPRTNFADSDLKCYC